MTDWLTAQAVDLALIAQEHPLLLFLAVPALLIAWAASALWQRTRGSIYRGRLPFC